MKKRLFSVVYATVMLCTAIPVCSCAQNSEDEGGKVIRYGCALSSATETCQTFETIVKNSDGTSIAEKRKSSPLAPYVTEYGTEKELITAVGQSFEVVGYVSLRMPLGENVNMTTVNNVTPSVDNIENGTYALVRPLELIYTAYDTLTPLAKNFLSFIGCDETHAIIKNEGYARVGESLAYTAYRGMETVLRISATDYSYPLIRNISNAFEEKNRGVEVIIERDENTEETVRGGAAELGATDGWDGAEELCATRYAEDGICVVVKKESKCKNVTFEQLYRLYVEGLPIETI